MLVNNLALFAKAQYKKQSNSLKPLREHPLVQATVAAVSIVALFVSTFVFLFNMLGAFLAAGVMVILLEKVFGFQILNQNYAF